MHHTYTEQKNESTLAKKLSIATSMEEIQTVGLKGNRV